MESSASYLHKKFKKQLNIESRINNNNEKPHQPQQLQKQQEQQKEGAESGKEKSAPTENECSTNKITERTTTRRDNNNSVPNQSTNQNINNFVLQTKSSISIANIQSNSCISVSTSSTSNSGNNHSQNDFVYFDNSKFNSSNSEPTVTSSILNNSTNHKRNEDLSTDNLTSVDKNSTQQQQQSGKYVCNYCSLVCSKPSVLQKHIRAHTNERPYPCISCGFSFKTRSNLYKHCRSRAHANRVMGNKIVQEGDEVIVEEQLAQQQQQLQQQPHQQQLHQPVEFVQEIKTKPYKPRFHTGFKENEDKDDSVKNNPTSDLLSHHINEIISKNNSIVNSSDPYLLKKRPNDVLVDNNDKSDEPLNLTNKNRKRCMSEVVEPVAQKSLIKELLLKNLYSDMQCPYCKMIFQTVTELELHKLRSCKGFVRPSEKYSRSSSVNVASILTHNKNAFDNIPHLQYTMFPMKSPGPFLGKTRLVESDKSKSFSFEDVLPPTNLNLNLNNSDRLLSPLTLSNDKRAPVKLFGGEVKITHNTGETKSFKIDTPEQENFNDYNCKLSENRVIKSSLQSGGTVLTNKAANYAKDNHSTNQDVIRVYENTSLSPSIDISSLTKPKFNFDSSFKVTSTSNVDPDVSYKYTNIVDFSQKAIKMLTPNIKQPSIIPPIHLKPNKFAFEPAVPPPKDPIHDLTKEVEIVDLTRKEPSPKPFMNPMNLYVNGKVVRYVPGMPGPVLDVPINMTTYKPPIQSPVQRKLSPVDPLEIKTDLTPPPPPPPNKSPNSLKDKQVPSSPVKKFARPNSLALKPTTASLKQHHGLTPTMFNQILISPDTPRVAKKYVHQFLHGNYFSYLGLKSSTKPVYCTLNKTQPFYVPHFKKLSMYSEWRQQDTKADKLYVSAYDSRQKHQRYTTAGKVCADLVVHSSYKFIVSDTIPKGDRLNEDHQKPNMILGGYESNEDYTYIRGRGRGRYVCDQCGIRCKKPSMLKKHIRTHSNDRPYTCNHCNFSFKTKGNLTKHMKSKAHTKNYAASGSSSSSTQLSGTQSSESDTDDSGMDSSGSNTLNLETSTSNVLIIDESTRREEHEAAYGLLSLSQKPSQISPTNPQPSSTSSAALQESYVMDTEEIVQISKTTYAKNKILDEKNFSAPKNIDATTIQQHTSAMKESKEVRNFIQFLGKTTTNRPLTYPYTSIPPDLDSNKGDVEDKEQPKSIKQFHVIQKYAPSLQSPNKSNGEWEREVFIDKNLIREKVQQRLQLLPVVKVNDVVVYEQLGLRKRKSAPNNIENFKDKMQKSDEVIDLSMANDKERFNGSPLTLNPDEESHSKKMLNNEVYSAIKYDTPPKKHFINEDDYQNYKNNDYNKSLIKNNGNVLVLAPLPEPQPQPQYIVQEENKTYKEFDNSAMETLADIATKQVKLEKNTLAKSVASEYLKLATKNEYNNREDQQCCQNVDELIVKPEGSKSCSICSKSFSKPSQLRLHMNIHYLERPFRCDSCSVSFRTKGHLQKHERSASHHNKLSSSPALSSSEPRPFKCVDCNIAFRIHGHLAKHLRSKMHIMKLECLAKIPFGLYAELERSNSLLTEINTSDGDQCLKSLKTLAKKVFVNDPNKLNQLETVEPLDVDS